MMLELSYSRLKDILTILLISRNEINSNYLALKLKVSERTVRTDILKLNEDIEGYEVKIKHRRLRGYFIDFNNEKKLHELKLDLEKLDEKTLFDSFDDRLRKLLCLLLFRNKPISLEKISNNLYISTGTLNNYIEDIKGTCKKYNLRIIREQNALLLIGDELAKRQCFIDQVEDKNYKNYVLGFSDLEKQIFGKLELTKLEQIVDNMIEEFDSDIADFNRKNIIIHIAITINRIQSNNMIKDFQDTKLITQKALNRFKYLFLELEQSFNVKIFEAERRYIEYHIALNNPQIIQNVKNNCTDDIHSAIMLFLNKIRNNYGFNLTESDNLMDNLINHVKSLIKIKQFNSSRKNPLLGVIVSTFPLAYEMTKTSIYIIEKRTGLNFDDDEISFVTLHVGAAMEQIYGHKTIIKKVAIVCGSGTATANLLKIKLETKFNNYIKITGLYSFEEYKKGHINNVDFIISTVPILDSTYPIIQIDLKNFSQDSKELYNFITSTENQSLSNLFETSLVFTKQHVKSKNEVMEKLVNALENQNVITSNYRSLLIQRESMYSTVIGGGIAIPHPIKFSAYKSRVAFMQMDEPVDWDDKSSVNLVFMLAINEKDYPKIQSLFSFLVDLQENNNFFKMVRTAKNKTEVVRVIQQFMQGFES
jgi:lichenan operon transcriptional antiterminator